ncbi:hypothetical protein SAMN05216235_2829 [Salinicoccus halodurans]|uniref:Uncharacterized protein n=1 Tax=Salinicoccus halodurans TaxID=407035 RepID=A0AA94HIL3_9STAP|nr:hypothetical protein SAMN05216235_2829 [Salinicoccus halodurans]
MSIPFFILAVVFLTIFISSDNNSVYLILAIVFSVLAITTYSKNRKKNEKKTLS